MKAISQLIKAAIIAWLFAVQTNRAKDGVSHVATVSLFFDSLVSILRSFQAPPPLQESKALATCKPLIA